MRKTITISQIGSDVLVSSLMADRRPILALNCRLQVEQVNVMEPDGRPLALALRYLHFLSAS